MRGATEPGAPGAFAALARSDPIEARRVFLAALDAARGRMRDVGERIGLSRSQVYRYARLLDVWKDGAAVRERYFGEEARRAAETLRALLPEGARVVTRKPPLWSRRFRTE